MTSPTLYHYIHCPYCIRVRMATGLLKLKYKSTVLPYEDEETPTRLIGKKMLPIWVDSDGKAHPESLDIISLIDKENRLKTMETLQSKEGEALNTFLKEYGSLIHNISMPYLVFTQEFSDKSRDYFVRKKEESRGSFEDLLKNRSLYEKKITEQLNILESQLSPFFLSTDISILDICLASHLWSLYVVPEFQFSEKMHQYLQMVKSQCNFSYYE